jgi:hypothetical protein
VNIQIDQHDLKLMCMLSVTDHAPGGIPEVAIKYLKNNLGQSKVIINKKNSLYPPGPAVIGVGMSSRSGLPHIAELYHLLTQSGGDDFDLRVTSDSCGSLFQIRFVADLVTPVSTESPDGPQAGKTIIGTDDKI